MRSKEYLAKELFNSINKLTFDNIEEVELQDDIDKGCLTNEQLNTIEAELCAKDDISTNCNCNNNNDIVILVDTRFERRCIKISIRS